MHFTENCGLLFMRGKKIFFECDFELPNNSSWFLVMMIQLSQKALRVLDSS